MKESIRKEEYGWGKSIEWRGGGGRRSKEGEEESGEGGREGGGQFNSEYSCRYILGSSFGVAELGGAK